VGSTFKEFLENLFSIVGGLAGAYFGLYVAAEQFMEGGAALITIGIGAIVGAGLGKAAGTLAYIAITIAVIVGFFFARQAIWQAISEYFASM